MDSVFCETWNAQVKKFKYSVMRDYREYVKHNDEAGTSGYFDFSTPEFKLLQYFSNRLEDYIRRYLINGFWGRVLEQRGNGIYPSSLPENTSKAKHFSTKEYEELTGYEFVADFYESHIRTMVLYIDISEEDANRLLSEDTDEVCVVLWDGKYRSSHCTKEVHPLKNGKKLIRYSPGQFMIDHGFSIEESQLYEVGLLGITTEVQDLLGIKTIPKLNSSMLFRFRFTVENKLREHICLMNRFYETEIRNPVDDSLAFNWAYHILNEDNRAKYPTIEAESKEMLFKGGALSCYQQNQLYAALIGCSDFAQSFITSEYLCLQFDSSDQFDYTAIVSGYLKSVEQLLYHIALTAIDKNLEINYSGKKLAEEDKDISINWKKGQKRKVGFTQANLSKGYCDITLGSLTYFLRDSQQNIIDDEKKRVFLFNCLQCYIQECRNGSFHKINIYHESTVQMIRNNTIVVIELLLGLCKIGNSDYELKKTLGIRDDSFERLFYWLFSAKTDFFVASFNGEKEIRVALRDSDAFPDFNRYGYLPERAAIRFDCIDQIDVITGKRAVKVIWRNDDLPEMWYEGANGTRVYFPD